MRKGFSRAIQIPAFRSAQKVDFMYEIPSQIIERYHSKRFSFIDLPLDSVVDELNRNDPSSSIKSSVSPVAGSWPQLLVNRATPPTTSVLVRSNSRWSMIVNNDLLHNPSPVFLSLAYKLKRACVSLFVLTTWLPVGILGSLMESVLTTRTIVRMKVFQGLCMLLLMEVAGHSVLMANLYFLKMSIITV